jgi:hypothetical protein
LWNPESMEIQSAEKAQLLPSITGTIFINCFLFDRLLTPAYIGLRIHFVVFLVIIQKLSYAEREYWKRMILVYQNDLTSIYGITLAPRLRRTVIDGSSDIGVSRGPGREPIHHHPASGPETATGITVIMIINLQVDKYLERGTEPVMPTFQIAATPLTCTEPRNISLTERPA